MIEAAIAAAGLGFFAALAAVCLAAAIEQAGAPREPSEEPQRRGWLAATLALTSLVSPGVLVAYGYFCTTDQGLRILLMAMPIAAVVSGAMIGAALGVTLREARAMFRMTRIVTNFGALIVALGVTLTSIDLVWAASHTAWLANGLAR